MEAELTRLNKRAKVLRMLRNSVFCLMSVAAAVALVAIYILFFLDIRGDSMADTLRDGDLVVALVGAEYEPGDIIAFYHNNEILVKRVIAEEGDTVDMDEEGNIYINGALIEEPYIREKSAAGGGGTEFPCIVPEGRLFVLGDNRPVSVDSRSASVGCVKESSVVGKVFLRLKPFNKLGFIE